MIPKKMKGLRPFKRIPAHLPSLEGDLSPLFQNIV